MNFIIRNLGWILLIIFFTFMLYLISNQSNTKNISITNTGSIIEDVNNTDIKNKIDNNKLIIEKYNLNKYSLSETGTIEIKNKEIVEEKKEIGFIQSVKNYFSTNKDTKIKEDKNESIIAMEKNLSPDNIEESIKKINTKDNNLNKKEIIKNIKLEAKKTEVKKIDTTEYKKEENKKIEIKEIKENKAQKLIREKIKEKNKNRIHTVGVKSIFLNNAYFTKRIATAYKGDNLEQLTNTNKYGCFKTEVLKARNIKIKGLKAWTCIYYMEGFLGTRKNYEVASKIYNRNVMKKMRTSIKISSKIKSRNKARKIYRSEDGSIIIKKDPYRVYEGKTYNTKVGSLYLIRVNSLKLNNKTFTSKKGYLEKCTSKNCDILEQLTPINNKGCFKVNVYKSKTNRNKRGYVCQKYLR